MLSGSGGSQDEFMPIAPLLDDDVTRIAASYGLPVTGEDIASFRVLAGAPLTSYDEVERRYAAGLPSRRTAHGSGQPTPTTRWARGMSRPRSRRRDGPLAGRRVAVKDNIAVAGVPMMNGSAVLEGFVPRRDATVVTRLLDAGATITGKAVCEDLCFSGGSHTSATGPVRNPWDHTGQRADHPAAAPPWSRPGGRPGARRRPGRLDPDPAASAAPSGTSRRTAWYRTPARSRSRYPRSPGPDHQDREGRGADARRPGRAGRARPASARRSRRTADLITSPAWTRARGCGSAC